MPKPDEDIPMKTKVQANYLSVKVYWKTLIEILISWIQRHIKKIVLHDKVGSSSKMQHWTLINESI